MSVDPHSLSREEVAHYHEYGYCGPYTLCSPEEMAEIRPRIERVLATMPEAWDEPRQSRHLDNRVVYDLCTHPAVADRMICILGDNLILWRSAMFIKEQGAKEIPWHQDQNYWPLEPKLNISAWIAIDPAKKYNSCVQLLPGSHKNTYSHIPLDGTLFEEGVENSAVDDSNAVHMELEPGQFFLFTEKTLHRSDAHEGTARRIGLVSRVTVPFVNVDHSQLVPTHGCVLFRGEDRMGFNTMRQPPES
jgi:ectoine hydroxylase-related dioxygenase (phytanoyl-CoA dioxygenase family)